MNTFGFGIAGPPSGYVRRVERANPNEKVTRGEPIRPRKRLGRNGLPWGSYDSRPEWTSYKMAPVQAFT